MASSGLLAMPDPAAGQALFQSLEQSLETSTTKKEQGCRGTAFVYDKSYDGATNIKALIDQLATNFQLTRFCFTELRPSSLGCLMFSRKSIREKISCILGSRME